MVLLAVIFPFLLWIGGKVLSNLPLQGSMSAYYHGAGGAMRDVFVGILFAVGALLYLYKGFTTLENYALNLAGAFAIGVALFPMEWECGAECKKFSLHGTFAVLLFLCIAYVCLFRASDTLRLMENQAKVKRYRVAYRLLGAGMIVSPAIAWLLTIVLQPRAEERSIVFFVEAVAVFVFAAYWLVKSFEIASTDSIRLALEGKLSTSSYRVADIFRPISLDQIEPLSKQ
jgi:hypothetical protein